MTISTTEQVAPPVNLAKAKPDSAAQTTPSYPQKSKRSKMAKQKAKISPIFLRVKAFIVDLFIIVMPLFYGVTYLVLGSKEALWRNQAAIALIWLAYGVICAAFYARSAQTPGYKLAGLYLIDVRSGRKVSFFRALARFGCFVLAGFSVIGLLICFFRKDGLNLHDLLSGAAPVVRKDAQ